MHIESLPSSLRSLPGTGRVWIAGAACAAAVAAGGIAVVAGPGDDGVVAPSVTPGSVGSPARSGDLSRYDGALLHHHGVRVLRSSGTIQPTAAQRRAAERFHHR